MIYREAWFSGSREARSVFRVCHLKIRPVDLRLGDRTGICGTMITRIKLHLICPCRNWQQARFHFTGIVREFVPKKLQDLVR